jgi:beta-glucosidase
MKRKFLFRCLLIGHCLATMTVSFCAGQLAGAEDVPAYLRPNLPVDTRVKDLLSRMTLDEKIGQMVQADLGALADAEDVQTYALGSMLSGGNSKPPANNPATWQFTVHQLESWALKTRLKIPLLYGIDAVHGHNGVIGTVIFPHNIGLGATRDPALVEKAEHITALEMAGTGIRWTFAPCIAVAQNERWGRTYESFGQSPELVSQMATAAVRGFQGKELSGQNDSVLACAKHFIGDGGTQEGADEGDTVCDEATLRKLFLPPYRAAVQAGVGSIMASYSSWNGEKMHGQKHLLTGVLKQELGFKGFIISDDAGIDQISPDYKLAVQMAINAGIDMAMIPRAPWQSNSYVDFIRDLKELVAEGRVSEARINDAVSRILRVKFQMGLFEHPYTDDPALAADIGSAAHREVARQCVRESLVLLKNEKHTLPLSKKIKHVVVVGGAADNLGIQCGGWTVVWQGGTGEITTGGTTILDGIRQAVSPETEVTYSPDATAITNADAVIAVVGELPYAEWRGNSFGLEIDAGDAALVEQARASGALVVTIMLSGRPLILGPALDNSDAFVAAWLPGTEGQGVADVLFGDYKPTGKLPRLWPRDQGQAAANDMTGEPLFPFGFGLTY